MEDREPALATDPATVEEAVTREVEAWRKTLPWQRAHQNFAHPVPTAVGGLPDGWEVVSRLPGYQRDTDLFLIRRAGGGWVVLLHEYDLDRSNVFAVEPTLGDLYESVRAGVEAGDLFPARLDVVADWLKRVLAGMFDENDPNEAAQRMLFFLSGRLRTYPVAAAEHPRASR